MISRISNIDESEWLMTTFIPEVIRRKYASPADDDVRLRQDHCTLLWIDMSGFSQLSNRLMQRRETGVDALTKILNSHYDHVLNKIDEHGGQPLFFAGDGLMSAWPCVISEAGQSVESACVCAGSILSERHVRDDFDKLISIHAVIAFGHWELLDLEVPDGTRYFSFFGNVFSELARASRNSAPNEVLISNHALEQLPGTPFSVAVQHSSSILPGLTAKKKEIPPKPVLMLDSKAIQQLKSFIPRTLTLPITYERLKWISELRPVSSLFVRLPNQGHDSATNSRQLQSCVNVAAPLVMKFEGLLNQVWIDEKESNMLICFGPPPSAHTDNPQRCVRLALELHQLLIEQGFDNSIGITTGIAYCGILGNDVLRQYTIIGDVVNLSASIAGIRHSLVYCDKATYTHTNRSFAFGTPVHEKVKGVIKAVALYRPLHALEKLFRHGEDIGSIGRESDLQKLIYAYDRLLDGHGGCVIVEGDTGMGKSKLLDDFRRAVPPTDALILSATADFIERNTPYGVFSAIYKTLLETDGEELFGNNLVAERIEQNYGWKSSLLNPLLHAGLPESEEVKNFTGNQKVKAIHDLLFSVFREKCMKQPIVLILDDSQWIDDTSWTLLESIVNANLNCLLLFGCISHIGATIAGRIRVNERIVLDSLEADAIHELVRQHLHVTKIPDSILRLIEKNSHGNPFFAIELADSLVDKELVRLENEELYVIDNVQLEHLHLPETVRGAIRSRLDRLNPGSQLTLKVGSVIGHRFGKKIASEIYPILEERLFIDDYIHEARQAGFLSDLMVDELEGYLFNNASTAEVAYEMTLSEQRKLLHLHCARWYEEKFAQHPEPFFVRLAHHWRQAGDSERAATYHQREAIRLFSLGFVKEALDMGLEGVALLGSPIERMPEGIKRKIDEHLGAVQQLLHDKPIASLLHHKQLHDERVERIIRLLLELTPFAHQSQQVELFALMAITCLRLTLEEGNGRSAAEVYSMYSIIYKAFTGDSQTAYQWSCLALEVDKTNNHSLYARVNFIHCWFIALWLVPLRQLIEPSARAARMGFSMGDTLFSCFNLSLCVVLKATAGVPLNEVVQTAEEFLRQNDQLVKNAAFHLVHERQVAMAFQGKTNAYTGLTDERFSEEKDIDSICETDLYNQIGNLFVSRLKLHVHFGNWEEAHAWGEKAWPLLPAFASQPAHIELQQYFTITCIYLAKDNLQLNDKLLENANAGIGELKSWALHCVENFSHKADLAEGISHGLKGEYQRAAIQLTRSAENAAAHGYLQDCGLAYEHLARLQQQQGIPHMEAAENAVNAYAKWGASAKVEYLASLFS